MKIPAGHKIRLRSSQEAQAFADGLFPLRTERTGREVTFLDDAEIVPGRPPEGATENLRGGGRGVATAGGKGAASLVSLAALILLVSLLGLTGCAGTKANCEAVRRSPYYPDRLTVGGTVGHDDDGGWDRETVGVSVSWPLKPREVVRSQPNQTTGATATP